MAALAYLLLPVTGMAAYLLGGTQRVRFHGLQAVVIGFVWPFLLYAGSAASPDASRVVLGAGALTWLIFLGATAAGRDLRIPVVGRALERLAASDPRSGDDEAG